LLLTCFTKLNIGAQIFRRAVHSLMDLGGCYKERRKGSALQRERQEQKTDRTVQKEAE
jgi:hypothetical protein